MADEERVESSSEMETGISVTIERPPEAVFAALTDVAAHTQWARGPDEITDISDDPVHLGTTWQQATRMLGKRLVNTMEVRAYEENRTFSFGSEKPMPMRMTFSLEPIPAGTKLRMNARGDLDGLFGKLAMPILIKSMERQMESDLQSLKAILEAEA
jgi:uncharacterized protein YndB with AHSA1/START domain